MNSDGVLKNVHVHVVAIRVVRHSVVRLIMFTVAVVEIDVCQIS